MSHRTRGALLGALLALVALVAACGGSDDGAADASSSAAPASSGAAPAASSEPAPAAPGSSDDAVAASPKVVASTSWVGAMAKLAGATDITVIAPSNIQHPPDYEPTASDLAALSDADVILLAGFEGFADRLKEAAGSDAKVVNVITDYDPAKLGPEVVRLAGELGTGDPSAAIDAYTQAYTAESDALRTRLAGAAPVVVAQAFVAGWAPFAGLQVAGTYGPEPTTPDKVAELAALKPEVVLENVHMGGGDEIAGATGATRIDLVNFPGDDLDLVAVVREDAALIGDALAPDGATTG